MERQRAHRFVSRCERRGACQTPAMAMSRREEVTMSEHDDPGNDRAQIRLTQFSHGAG